MKTQFSLTTRIITKGGEYDFRSGTSWRGLEGLPWRDDRQGSGGPPAGDEGDVVPHIESPCGDHRWDVVEVVGGAGHLGGFLAEDAGPVRPLARPKENTEGAPVPARRESSTSAGDCSSGKYSATSGERSTKFVPARKRARYFPRTPPFNLERSYSRRSS